MNIIKLKIDFTKREIWQEGVNIVENDYNSTKIVFEFDKEYAGRKVFELAKPNTTEAIFVSEIIDNEVILVGKAEVKDENNYIKYIDEDENVYWYDKINNKIYDSEYVEQTEITLEDLTKVLVNASIFSEEGDYPLEISLYDGDSKLTSMYHLIKVKPEMVKIGDKEIEIYLPILDQLMQQIHEIKKEAIKPYTSLERLASYLYKISFDTIPTEINVETLMGACSSFVQNGKLHRNLDWNYDENNLFLVQCKGFKGMAFINGLDDTNMDNNLIGQLPYHLIDGVNESGIMVSTHILYNDWDWHGVGNKNIPLTKLPYIILNEVKCINELSNKLANVLSNIKVPTAMEEAEYLAQYIVTDGVTTYAILPPMFNTGAYVIQDITSNPKLTNFRWVNNKIVNRTDLQTRPTGVERWNAIPTSLENLRFTKAYEEPTRLSEFIGINHTTKDSTDEELTTIYNTAHALYEERTRNGKTWQTTHSVVYSNKGIEELYIQENWDKDYINISGIKEETDPTVPQHVKNIQQEDISNWNNKASIEDIPTQLSELNTDSTHRTVTDEDKNNWNNKAEVEDIPTVPTKVSDLQNDSNYQTGQQVATAIGTEATNRENADNNLQNQIDALSNSNDVVDVLATYQDLLDYDTQHLKNNDIIKVMTDSSHSNAISYFKWVIVDNIGSWNYVGSQGPFYTKSEANTKFEDKSNKVITIASTSTDTEYPSAKAVYTLFNSIIDGDEVSF